MIQDGALLVAATRGTVLSFIEVIRVLCVL